MDLGAGSGWPGLYMGMASGCDVVLADLPLAGLRIAAERAQGDGLPGEVWAAVADAAALPFSDGSFDAISHSDLLCCLKRKRAVLAGCRRVIGPHGRMVFTVISVAPGLSAEPYGRAVANGPEFVETDTDYPSLLAETGWIVTEYQDITAAYALSCRRQLDADQAQKDALVALMGVGEVAGRLAGWRAKLEAIGNHLLKREFFAVVPHRQ